MDEQWRVIPSIPVYEVSDLGRIRRLTPTFGTEPGHILKPYTTRRGYLKISLHMEGKRFQRFVHRVVAEAFIGPCPAGHVVHHRDHDQGNSKLENLEYRPRQENQTDAWITSVKRNPMGAIPEILAEAWVRGWALKDLADRLGVSVDDMKKWLLRQESPNGRVAEISQRLWSLVIR